MADGQLKLTSRDVQLLAAVRDSTFITIRQLDSILGNTEGRTARSRRVKKLHDIDQIAVIPQCYPYPGRVLYITNHGLTALQISKMPMLSVSSETESPAMLNQIPHYLGINDIEISFRRYLRIKSWTGDRRLKSLNLSAILQTAKDYDAIVDIVSIADEVSTIRLGIEYERTIKSVERYKDIKKTISEEEQIHGLIYFVDTEEVAKRVAQYVYSDRLRVAVLILSSFHEQGLNSMARVVDVEANKIVRITLQAYLSKF
jgi:hypothetical protein